MSKQHHPMPDQPVRDQRAGRPGERMAVGKDIGDYAARLRAATEQAVSLPGFAFTAPQTSWNAPKLPDKEREERAETQKQIEKGLSVIDSALSSPNLSETQRSELMLQKTALEGAQMQLQAGLRSVDVAQISAMVASVTASASSTASVASAGSSIGSPAAFAAAQVEYQRVSEQTRSFLRDTAAAFEARNNEAFGIAKKHGIDISEEQRAMRDAEKREKEEKDPEKKLDARIDRYDAQISMYDKMLADEKLSEAERKRLEEQRKKALEEREQAEALRQQAQEKHSALEDAKLRNDPTIPEEQKQALLARNEAMRELEEVIRNREKTIDAPRVSNAGLSYNAAKQSAKNELLKRVPENEGKDSNEVVSYNRVFLKDKEDMPLATVGGEVRAAWNSEALLGVALGADTTVASKADTPPATAQQIAQAPEALEAAKSLAQNKTESAEADAGNKTAQPVRVATATTNEPSAGR